MQKLEMHVGVKRILQIAIGASVCAALASTLAQEAKVEPQAPKVIAPGATDSAPPDDAVVLFDGKSLQNWQHLSGSPANWLIGEDGAMTIHPRSGAIVTKQSFGAAQIHVEFATPTEIKGNNQGRGNSGVYVQGRYEVQILDSFDNETYPNGQCGAIYGQYPPLVNVCRPPGEWQTYDIVFHPPRFNPDGRKTFGGSMTVFHNGVLIQDHVELQGTTVAAMASDEPGVGPLYLQDHGNAVRYRNIWVREFDP